jgi:hypothetical protein
MPMRFAMKVPPHKLTHWAAQYSYGDEEAIRIGARARRTGRLPYEAFLALAEWKTPRSKSRCRQNSPGFVEEVTRHALSASEPRFKIEVLRLLAGIDWATASVILHFCDRDRWPILDVRAFWSLGQEVPSPITYPVWEAYTAATRALADRHNVPMRALDRALWAYSKAKQGPLNPT